MIKHNVLFDLDKDEFFIGGDKWRTIESTTPYTHEKQDLNGVWAAAVLPKDNGLGGLITPLGLSIATATGLDWKTLTSPAPSISAPTYASNDEVCVIFSNPYLGAKHFSVKRSPDTISVIYLTSLGYLNNTDITSATAYVGGIVWSGTKWVMAIRSGSKIYILWSDEAETWRFADNNPTGLPIITNSLFNANKELPTLSVDPDVDDALMLTYVTSGHVNHTTFSTDSFNATDLTGCINSGSVFPRRNQEDSFSHIFKVGTRWVMLRRHAYTTNSSESYHPYYSLNNGASWIAGARILTSGQNTYLTHFLVSGNRLVVFYYGPGTTYLGMKYTDDFTASWTEIIPGQWNGSANVPAKSSDSVYYSSGGAWAQLEEFEGNYILPLGWGVPLSGNSISTHRKHFTGISKASIDALGQNGVNQLVYTFFNDHQRTIGGETYYSPGQNIFRFQGYWITQSGASYL